MDCSTCRKADPSAWLEARTNFARTTAAWSLAGHMIGLGDRHCDNLLIDVSTGANVQIDFGHLFDSGRELPVPEIVPFRLTQNMVDSLGVCGVEGPFRASCCAGAHCWARVPGCLCGMLPTRWVWPEYLLQRTEPFHSIPCHTSLSQAQRVVVYLVTIHRIRSKHLPIKISHWSHTHMRLQSCTSCAPASGPSSASCKPSRATLLSSGLAAATGVASSRARAARNQTLVQAVVRRATRGRSRRWQACGGGCRRAAHL